jgi:hypothetical protein
MHSRKRFGSYFQAGACANITIFEHGPTLQNLLMKRYHCPEPITKQTQFTKIKLKIAAIFSFLSW